MENTHTYILEVVDTDTSEILFRAETFTADSMIQEVAKAEGYISARLAEMDADEGISEKEADRIETDSHVHA